MRSKKLILMLISLVTLTSLTTIDSGSYKYHDTIDNVALYYKVDDYGIWFKAKNQGDDKVKVTINNVKGKWSNGKTTKEDIEIKWVYANDSETGRFTVYNYSKLEDWSFSSWSIDYY